MLQEKRWPQARHSVKRRIAAAVEKQQRLLTPLDRGAHRLRQRWRNEATARRAGAAQIDRLDVRHMLPPESRRQRDALIAPLRALTSVSTEGVAEASTMGIFAMCPRTTAMRGRDSCAPFVLLVGLVVFLIDNDEAQIGVRQEQRRAGADHDMRLAG